MLTLPAYFARFNLSTMADFRLVVKITAGADIYYFSDAAFFIGNQPVYAGLGDVSGLTTKIDYLTRAWSPTEISVQLANVPLTHKAGSAGWNRVSDLLLALRNTDLVVYARVGQPTTDTDMLAIFTGKVLGEPSYNNGTISIRGWNYNPKINKTLPQVQVKDRFASAPTAFRERYFPLVYGEHKFEHAPTTDTGLIPTMQYSRDYPPKYKASHHPMKTLSGAYCVTPQNPLCPADIEGETVVPDAADGAYGYGYIALALTPDNYYAISRWYPYAVEQSELLVTSPQNIWDDDPATYANLYDDLDPGPDAAYWREFHCNMLLPSLGSGDGCPYGGPVALGGLAVFEISYKFQEVSWMNTKWAVGYEPRIRVQSDDGSVDVGTINLDGTAGTKNFNYTTSPVLWGANIGYDPPSKNGVMQVWGLTKTNADFVTNKGDGVIGNQKLADLYQFHLRFRHTIKIPYLAYDYIWAAALGRLYDTWNDSRGSAYASLAGIIDPAGIIESLLREEAGFVTDEIDTASFTAAENTSVASRVVLYDANRTSLSQVIRKLTEQSTFCFYITAQGKARLVRLNDSSPTTDRVIEYSHFAPETLRVSKTSTIYNQMVIQSRYFHHLQAYVETTIHDNATSQAALDEVIQYNATWQNICGTSKDHVAGFLVSNANGIWVNDHIVVQFETRGATNIDLEEGEHIEIPTAFDATLPCYGASWSGLKFMIVEKTQTTSGNHFTAIKLY